jgi:hypothetical protein
VKYNFAHAETVYKLYLNWVQLQGVWLLPDLGSLTGVLEYQAGPPGTHQAIEECRGDFQTTILM